MSHAIADKFRELKARGGKAFIPFITAGDPNLEATIRLVPELERSGSHLVELGIPFSDPLADGPTIQRASERALKHGYRLADYLEAVKIIRRETALPIILFSYYNPLLQYGLGNLARDASSAGVDGLLVTDMTPEEGGEYCACLEQHGLDTIFLAAPTSSPDRLEKIARCCRGFVYVVSRTGVTGAQERLSASILPTITGVRRYTQLPVAVGFGISRPAQVRAVWEIADAAVVGSAIVAQIENAADSDELLSRVGEFCRWLTEGSDV
ncbi:MAG TPA: tryptophan synthase subunit alpha [Acidobacteriota bacterium]|nr:tryptophan synthase subunit alpha [Acidobacteriota bacterium]